MSINENPICNPEATQLDEVTELLLKFIKLSMQAKHFGKNKYCPECHLMLEAIEYCKKYHNIENVPAEYREEALRALEEAEMNPRKYIFS